MEHDQMTFTGYLGRDPEMRYTPNQKKVTGFSVATNRNFKNGKGEDVQETIWRRVEAWGSLAELCNKFLKAGSRVLIVGRLKPDPETGGPRIWEREDGSKGANFEVVAKSVLFLDRKKEENPDEDFPF